jgi:hypothetical protein
VLFPVVCHPVPCRLLLHSSLALTPLPGPLPPSWGDLCCITEIDLQQNYMTGGLPDSWGKLSLLQTL